MKHIRAIAPALLQPSFNDFPEYASKRQNPRFLVLAAVNSKSGRSGFQIDVFSLEIARRAFAPSAVVQKNVKP
jgi:hypothetical protein